jgi:hypothetical protein
MRRRGFSFEAAPSIAHENEEIAAGMELDFFALLQKTARVSGRSCTKASPETSA